MNKILFTCTAAVTAVAIGSTAFAYPMTESAIPEEASAIDVINMYTHGDIDRDTYNLWTEKHGDTAFRMVAIRDILDFEEAIKEGEEYIIRFAEGSLPKEVTAESLIYDVVSGEYLISEYALRAIASEKETEFTVTDWQGIDIMTSVNGSIIVGREIAEVAEETREAETEINYPEFTSYLDALNDYAHGKMDRPTFDAWTEANADLVHAYISVDKLTKGPVEDDLLVEVDINTLDESENITDLFYDIVKGKYYMRINKHVKNAAEFDNGAGSDFEIVEEDMVVTPVPAPREPDTQPAAEPATQPSHIHSYQVAASTPASCSAAGSTTYKCSCGDSYMESTPALSHNWEDVFHGYKVTVVTKYICNTCGNQYDDIYAFDANEPEHGSWHVEEVVVGETDLGEWYPGMASDYTGPILYQRCTVCGAIQ